MAVKGVLLIVCVLSSYFISFFYIGNPFAFIVGPLAGVFVALLVINIENYIRETSLNSIIGGVIGIIVGLIISLSLAYGLRFISDIIEKQQVVPWIYFSLSVILAYIGMAVGSKKIEESSFFNFLSGKEVSNKKLLDTSVIVEGRIVDLCKTGFIEGTLIVPKFVIDELQYIADSSDSLRRSRGRRGLDMLNQMKRDSATNIEIIERDAPKEKGVDGKLVVLAQKMNSKIITNDFNLNKVAELRGVNVLNLNELSNALKPVVLPGEMMSVSIIKDGKENGQGVGYFDDGTMIVVDRGHQFIGSTIDVVVTSIIQTTAGRMIFAEVADITERDHS